MIFRTFGNLPINIRLNYWHAHSDWEYRSDWVDKIHLEEPGWLVGGFALMWINWRWATISVLPHLDVDKTPINCCKSNKLNQEIQLLGSLTNRLKVICEVGKVRRGTQHPCTDSGLRRGTYQHSGEGHILTLRTQERDILTLRRGRHINSQDSGEGHINTQEKDT